MSVNPYKEEVRVNLPRILGLFDNDRTSQSYGMGDRYYWAWGLIDFGNATFQGAAHGLARLWCSGNWPYETSVEVFLERINAMFQGAQFLTRRDGSLEEAFPHEGSYCVTALVAFDLLCTLELLEREIDEQTASSWQAVIKPMIAYLVKADETHALISNHLATAVAALVRWHGLTGETSAEKKARELLERILAHQSEEGWFLEYEGADPGYQSLCTYYLADVHRQRPDLDLMEPLQRSIGFLQYFAHPDGSFGGLYGSRNTRFYFPAGVMVIADQCPQAASLARFMEANIAEQRVVTLSAIDEPNLVPMFNAYCWSAQLANDPQNSVNDFVLPAARTKLFRKHFSEAGLLIDAGPGHYTVINTHKGGVIAHYCKTAGARTDGGVVISNSRGQFGSTQAFITHNPVQLEGNILTVEAPIVPMPRRLPAPSQFMLLRLLSLTFFRFRIVREWTKQALVKFLITPQKKWPLTNKRKITLGPELDVTDTIDLPSGYRRVQNLGAFVSIHMASQGYWQIQDEDREA